MVGLSLRIDVLSEKAWDSTHQKLLDDFSGLDGLLTAVKNSGVDSVELRVLFANQDPVAALRIAEKIWAHGMEITVHGTMESEETAVEDVLNPVSEILKNLKQDKLNITIHAVKNKEFPDVETSPIPTINALKNIAEAIKDLPVVIALENNRKKKDDDPGNCTEKVLEIVKAVNNEKIKTCWDMGHHYYNCKAFTDDEFALPSEEFLERVVHTHIHGLVDGKTHFDLDETNLPIEKYLKAMNKNFSGVYNLELTPNFWAEYKDVYGGFESSIKTLISAKCKTQSAK